MKASETLEEKKARTLEAAAREVMSAYVTVLASVLADLTMNHPEINAVEIAGFTRTLRALLGQNGEEHADVWEHVLPRVLHATCQTLGREKTLLH